MQIRRRSGSPSGLGWLVGAACMWASLSGCEQNADARRARDGGEPSATTDAGEQPDGAPLDADAVQGDAAEDDADDPLAAERGEAKARIDRAMPARTIAENVAYVEERLSARGLNPIAFVRGKEGRYGGRLSLGERSHHVEGVIAATGPLAFASQSLAFELRNVQVDAGAGTVRASLHLDDGTVLELFASDHPTRIDGVVLPGGWTRDDYLDAERQVSTEELAHIGHLHLEPAPPGYSVDLASVVGSQDFSTMGMPAALQLDAEGNLAGVLGGCTLRGGAMPQGEDDALLAFAGEVEADADGHCADEAVAGSAFQLASGRLRVIATVGDTVHWLEGETP